MRRPLFLVLGVVVLLLVGYWVWDDRYIFDDRSLSRDVAGVFAVRMAPAFDGFRRDIGRYPTNEEGVIALVECPTHLREVWKGPYIEAKAFPLDPWARAYLYRQPGARNPQGYDLWSLGPDGVESTDDIGNWKK